MLKEWLPQPGRYASHREQLEKKNQIWKLIGNIILYYIVKKKPVK